MLVRDASLQLSLPAVPSAGFHGGDTQASWNELRGVCSYISLHCLRNTSFITCFSFAFCGTKAVVLKSPRLFVKTEISGPPSQNPHSKVMLT